jgi:hypothetical protein
MASRSNDLDGVNTDPPMLCRQPIGSSRVASRCRHGDLLERAVNLQERRKPITKWSSAFLCLMSTAALLVPFMAAADSHLQTKATDAKFISTAQVDFKIVIPTVIYLQLGNGSDRDGGPVPLRIMSNSRAMTLKASVRMSDGGGSNSSTPTSMIPTVARPISAVTAKMPASGDEAGRNVILIAAARKIIAQDEECILRDAHPAAVPANAHGVVHVNAAEAFCTVSMP